jgi:hypothetical protein
MRVSVVMCNTLAWGLAFLSIPSSLFALSYGVNSWLITTVVLVASCLALGGLFMCIVIPMPIGAEPTDVPHMTLCHPHGIICNGFPVIGLGYSTWSASRLATHGSPHFLATGSTLFADRFARCGSCRCSSPSRESITRLMRTGKDIFLYPGGLIEAARHSYHKDVVDVGSRGAIRLALCHGYAVRVCFAFGERKTAYNLQGLWKLRIWLAKRGVPAVVPFFLPWAPSPRVAFSPTIQLPVIEDPTAEDVEHWHGEYVAALRAVHAAYKEPHDELVVHGSEAIKTKSR